MYFFFNLTVLLLTDISASLPKLQVLFDLNQNINPTCSVIIECRQKFSTKLVLNRFIMYYF